MTRIVEKNWLAWEKYSEKYMAFNLSASMLGRLKTKPEGAFNPAAALPEIVAFAGRKDGRGQ